jgi:prepilin-type processing-associated H-X9-DG protein
MYSNESPGGKFPTMQAGVFPYHDYTRRASTIDLAPNIFAGYPEYLTDPWILVCPSDPDAADMETRFLPPPGAPNVNPAEVCFGFTWPTSSDGTHCASATDVSYTYLGWVVDRYAPRYGIGNLATITSVMGLVGESDMIPANPPTDGPLQLVATVESLFTSEFIAAVAAPNPGPAQAVAMAAVVDGDIQLDAAGLYAGQGNGGSNTVYRLAEGIERQLVVDVTNAGATAISQSELPVMFDQIAYIPSSFNHVPGGSNILFMDGHVEFMKYQPDGEVLCNQLVANILGIMAAVF